MRPEEEDLKFMRLALEQASAAVLHQDIPVGAVVVKNGKVIGTGKNEREKKQCPTAHAEIEAIHAAADNLGDWNLSGAKIYVTLEPCVMCAGALVLSRIEEVIYAAKDPKGGALALNIPILDNPALNHRVKFREGPLQEEASALLTSFFRSMRKQKKTPDTKN